MRRRKVLADALRLSALQRERRDAVSNTRSHGTRRADKQSASATPLLTAELRTSPPYALHAYIATRLSSRVKVMPMLISTV